VGEIGGGTQQIEGPRPSSVLGFLTGWRKGRKLLDLRRKSRAGSQGFVIVNIAERPTNLSRVPRFRDALDVKKISSSSLGVKSLPGLVLDFILLLFGEVLHLSKLAL
jgi:hypothetical protein